jgi:hypothetical protein
MMTAIMMKAPGWCCEATDVVTMQQKLKSSKMFELVKKEANCWNW